MTSNLWMTPMSLVNVTNQRVDPLAPSPSFASKNKKNICRIRFNGSRATSPKQNYYIVIIAWTLQSPLEAWRNVIYSEFPPSKFLKIRFRFRLKSGRLCGRQIPKRSIGLSLLQKFFYNFWWNFFCLLISFYAMVFDKWLVQSEFSISLICTSLVDLSVCSGFRYE